jgi:molybdopterin-guanine dinucleotide biosynthesis protein A
VVSEHAERLEGRRAGPIGVVLAGGLGQRIGGSKATVMLGDKPLISYPLEALASVLGRVAIIAKAETELPSLPGVSVWIEPSTPRHPLAGITHALRFAEGRDVLVCAADLPLVTAALVQRIARADPGRSPAVVAVQQGAMQPLLGCYQPRTVEVLRAAELGPNVALRDAVAAIDPLLLEVEDPDELFNVNSRDDLVTAAALLERRANRR